MRKPECDYDVVGTGGGAGGVSASFGASHAGARVLLVGKYGLLGGAATTSQVLAYCGFFQQGSDPIKAVDGAAGSVTAKRLGAQRGDTRNNVRRESRKDDRQTHILSRR